MPYDFETVVDRRNSGSAKWNMMLKADPGVPAGIVPLSVGDMELKTAPELVDGLKRYLDDTVLGYTSPTEEYFEAVTAWFSRRHGWNVDQEWIVPVDGVVPAMFSATKAFTSPGDSIVVMPPVYYPFFRAAGVAGRHPLEVPLIDKGNGYAMDFDRLDEVLSQPRAKMLFLCSPHNPVCRIWSQKELERLGEICRRHGILVVSDEIHMDFMMPGHAHTVFASLGKDAADNCLVCTAPSKTFNIAGLQTSNIMIPNARLRRRYKAEISAAGREGPGQLALAACRLAYSLGGPWFDELLKLVRKNAESLRDFFAAHFPEIIVYPHEGTYFIWVDFRAWGLEHKELEQFMVHKARLFLDEGYIFGNGGAGFERFNLACPMQVLGDALERLRRAGRPSDQV